MALFVLLHAAPVAARLTAGGVRVLVYSDGCAGERIIVITAKTTWVLFQTSGGPPLWAEAHMDGATITFVLHDPQGRPSTFKGTMTDQEIAGSFSNSSGLHLLRRPSIADCAQIK